MLDHGLKVAGTVVDLVGLDGEGRLVLGLLGSGSADDATTALKALAFVRRRGGELAEHLGRTIERAASRARVVLVAEAATRELCDLVAPLEVAGVELFETHIIESHRGARTFVSTVSVDGAGSIQADEPPAQEASSAPSQRERPDEEHAGGVAEAVERTDRLAQDLIRRIERLDDRLDVRRSATLIRWSLAGHDLCSLDLGGDRPRGGLGQAEAQHELTDAAAVETFLQGVMERFLVLADDPPLADGGEDGGLADERPANGSSPAGGRTLGAAQLLTPEEIEAFREPL